MNSTLSVAVLGGGSFGTAIANLIASNGFATTLWMRDLERAKETQQTRENKTYLPGYFLADALTVTADLQAALAHKNLVFFSVPSSSFAQVVEQAKPYIVDD